METLLNRDLFTYKLSSSKEMQYAIVVLVRRLTEWRRFHFSYQPRDAVNSGPRWIVLPLNVASIHLAAIPVQN